MARPKKNPDAALNDSALPPPPRIFAVCVGSDVIYVKAATKAQAIRHVMAKRVAAYPMPDEVIAAHNLLGQVQDATSDAA
jgi:hypothetical protein